MDCPVSIRTPWRQGTFTSDDQTDPDTARIRKSARLEESIIRLFQGNSVEEGNPRVVATAGAVKTVVENPFFPILKLNSHIAQAARHLRSARFHHDAAPPRPKPPVKYFIPDLKVNMFFNSSFSRRLPRRRKEVISNSGKVGDLGSHLPDVIHITFLAKSVPTLACLSHPSPVDPDPPVRVW